jgi:hypothetical protein
VDGQVGVVHRRRKGDRTGIKQAPGLKPCLAFLEIDACGANVPAGIRSLGDPHRAIVKPLGVFLDHHRVRARGHRRAGKNPDCRSGGQSPVKAMSGSRFTLQLQHKAPACASSARTA